MMALLLALALLVPACWRGTSCLMPRILQGSISVQSVVTSYQHTCALLGDGRVKCWGANMYGQLGLGDNITRGDQPGQMGDALPAVDLGSGRTARQVSAGHWHTCALLDNGSIKCWGMNSHGQLGTGDSSDRGNETGQMGDALPAVNLGAGRTARQVAAGAHHTCALLDDATVKCWGSDWPPTVDMGTRGNATELSAGYSHTCAVLQGGGLKCWGHDGSGQLGLATEPLGGNGTHFEQGDALPTVDLGAQLVVQVSAGHWHTCTVLGSGSVKCWGGASEYGGMRGINFSYLSYPDGVRPTPAHMPSVDLGTAHTARLVSAGGWHTCALLDDYSMKCWGSNSAGQLAENVSGLIGDFGENMGDLLPPIDLGVNRTARQIATGLAHTCALLDDGSVKCWGSNSDGQLGQGPYTGVDMVAVDLGTALLPASPAEPPTRQPAAPGMQGASPSPAHGTTALGEVHSYAGH